MTVNLSLADKDAKALKSLLAQAYATNAEVAHEAKMAGDSHAASDHKHKAEKAVEIRKKVIDALKGEGSNGEWQYANGVVERSEV